MEGAVVRGILWRHLLSCHPWLLDGPGDGPPADLSAAAVIPAQQFHGALQRVADRYGPDALYAVGKSYGPLWQQTFQTLSKHLTGRPDAMLGLMHQEVWPYLQGEQSNKQTGLVIHQFNSIGNLPSSYQEGLLAGLVEISGARAQINANADGFHVKAKASIWMRLGALSRASRSIGIPLVLAAAMAITMGAFLATPTALFTATFWLLLLGVVSAQIAANAFPKIGKNYAGQLRQEGQSRKPAAIQTAIGATVALAAGGLLIANNPLLGAWAIAGAALGASYSIIRDAGLGPILSAIVHGPLLVSASTFALDPSYPLLNAAFVGVPVGLFSAASLFLGDMLDRPIDEARGRRTLAVRATSKMLRISLLAMVTAAMLAWGIVVLDQPPGVASFWLLGLLAAAATMQLATKKGATPKTISWARIANGLAQAAIVSSFIIAGVLP